MVSKFAIDFTDGPAPRRCIKPWSKTYGSTSHKHKWVNMGELIEVNHISTGVQIYLHILDVHPRVIADVATGMHTHVVLYHVA